MVNFEGRARFQKLSKSAEMTELREALAEEYFNRKHGVGVTPEPLLTLKQAIETIKMAPEESLRTVAKIVIVTNLNYNSDEVNAILDKKSFVELTRIINEINSANAEAGKKREYILEKLKKEALLKIVKQRM
ncbi:MAG: hypothetical protein ABSD68_00165 [Candidatus Micrarchaeales archaeon]|jgi:aspartate/methionine/tyrosine aminotransferase